MKKTNYCIMIMAIIGIAIIGACSNPNKQQTEAKAKEMPSIKLDSLAKLGIQITLWTESKEDYEKMINKPLKEASLTNYSFTADMSGMGADYHFDWPALKRWMKWQGNKIEAFHHEPGEVFVVVGSYFPSPDQLTLVFSGTLYKY